MPRIRYQVAMSLDGYIAGPGGEADWITMDPEIDFAAIFAQFDTFVMGRRTFEMAGAGGMTSSAGTRTFVFSRTLQAADHPGITVLRDVSANAVASLRAQATKDIWLFGGSDLAGRFLDEGLLDTVEVAVMPVLLRSGIPLVLPRPQSRIKLALTGHRTYGSGIVGLGSFLVLSQASLAANAGRSAA